MTASDGRARVLQQLIERGTSAEGAAAILTSASAVSHRLVLELTPILGAAGARAIRDRSLALAKRAHPWFDASLAQNSSDTPGRVEPQQILQATVAWLGLFVGLLETFIGERLTLRILHGVWPDLFPLGSKKESS